MAGFTTLFVFAGFFGALLTLLKWLLDKAKRDEENEQIRFNFDPFIKDNGYTWDFIFVFKVFEEDEKLNSYQRENTLKKTIRRLNKGGLQVKMFFSVQQDEVYIKVRATKARLKLEAARTSYKMLLDEKMAEARARKGGYDEFRKVLWRPLELSSSRRFSCISAYKYIHAKFVNDPNQENLYKVHRSTGSCFRSIDRIKLLVSIMESPPADGGCGIDIENLVANKAALAAFPLHTWPERKDLMDAALVLWMLPWNTPLDQIKDYCGEKIGLYFLFLTHYTTWLISAALVGVAIYVHVALRNGNPNVESIPAFCAFIAIWTTFFIEFWKRKEVTYAMRWGTTGFEDSQADRPEFQGQLVTSPVDGSKVKWADEGEKFRATLCSQVTISMAILCVIGAVVSIFWFKIFAIANPQYFSLLGFSFGPILVSLANSVQIQVMSAVYGGIATRLNDAENHRTQSEFEDSLISKTFIFQFVNSFASLFYIAFLKVYLEGDCTVSCLDELSTALSTIFLTRLVSGNINAIVVASMKAEQRKKAEMEGVGEGCTLTPAEREFSMEAWDTCMSTFVKYADLAVQFGYATLFAGAFPLSPVMALLDNYIKIRVDVWRLCMITRRPSPVAAEDIGTWLTIFDIMSNACVLTNCGLVFFTSNIFSGLTLFQRMACFAAFEHLLLLLKGVLEVSTPDVPEEVQLQLDRQDFITSKIIDNTPDDTEDNEASDVVVNMSILPTDDDYYYEASLLPAEAKAGKGYAELPAQPVA